MEIVKKEYQLLPETCDIVAESVLQFCSKYHVENKDAIICMLSVQDCLMYWMSHGLENKTLVLRMGMRMFTPYIILELEGEKINPLPQQDDDYGEYFRSIHLDINQKAEFSYKTASKSCVFFLNCSSFIPFIMQTNSSPDACPRLSFTVFSPLASQNTTEILSSSDRLLMISS